ncbi:sulfate adenylyltransferase [Pseudalkalibacillus decolorationis]|uniref:sulfate adenylyltransferase n=1 Tax=Pseudalkalibacillus decolorationis TaxID=163879 RepID=UPI00214755CB|nr:sulfate adenylyltransferase [Pseudalkalibacillus decolorationis]
MPSIPHGGKLISRYDPSSLEQVKKLKKIELSQSDLSELECIGTGAYSPLEGFMNQSDYDSVLKQMRLKDGTIWPLPINLSVSQEVSNELSAGVRVALSFEGETYGFIDVEEIYKVNLGNEAQLFYGTGDSNHPGVEKLLSRSPFYVGGPVTIIKRIPSSFPTHTLTPEETRDRFRLNGWETIVGFQTRNPVHRAHEYIQKVALEQVDGLFLHPLVGETKPDDVPAHVRMKCYQTLLNNYYPSDRSILGVFLGAMRYAGPKEALFHAIVRKNYGCTHFIVGRDHAGVGDYYGTYDSQNIFNQFSAKELGIVPLKFDHSFYCKKCEQMASSKTCPHTNKDHIHLSGTKVRQMLKQGLLPPKHFSRPEVVKLLLEYYRKQKD